MVTKLKSKKTFVQLKKCNHINQSEVKKGCAGLVQFLIAVT